MPPNQDVRIGILLASVRQGRRGEGFATWIRELVAARPGVAVEWLDLREHALGPYLHEQMPGAIERSYADPAQRTWSDTIHALDGYVMVTPEYNHSFPGQLKNALDHVQQGWWYKPAGFVSYGGTANGARAVDHLRGVAAELRMVTVRGEVNISLINLQRDDAGRPTDALYGKRAAAMIDQLLWWARACKAGRASETPPA
jgi:NAD(P)H-dependent FMN reductase